jgi:hypothetical protein
MSAERRLVSLRRSVPSPRMEAYGALWTSLAEEVVRAGAHAWRFVSPQDPELHLEFLEFKAAVDPRREPPVRALLDRLDVEAAAAATEEWLAA